MIRMVLFGLGFVAITAVLVFFQPGSSRKSADQDFPSASVTRAEPALSAAVEPVVQEPAQQIVQTQVKPRAVAIPQGEVDDASLRRMTWDTLSSLNQATGRENAPGQPGSLLHTIVQRSLNETPNAPRPSFSETASVPASDLGRVYVVQSGDSLLSISEQIYGDVNMVGRIFTANQAVLARPDDLRPGQTLVLPSQ